MTDQELDRLLDEWQAPPTPISLLEWKPARARRVWRWVLAGSLAAATLAVATTLSVLSPGLGATWGRLGDGTYFRTQTLVEPGIASWKYAFTRGAHGGRDLWREHYFYDDSEKSYWGYTVTFEPVGNHQYRAVVDAAPRSVLAGYRNIPLPQVPAPRVIAEREPLEIDLIRAGERVFDRIEVSSADFGDVPAKAPREGPYAPLWMRLANPRLFINGAFVMDEPIDAGGGTVWFTLPGRGQWVLALDPLGNSRFVEAGRVDGKTIEFTLEGESFRIEATEPVAPGGSRPLYVWHQRDSARATAEFGSSGLPSQFRN